MKRLLKNKNGSIALNAIVVLLIICLFLVVMIPNLNKTVGNVITGSTEDTMAIDGLHSGHQLLGDVEKPIGSVPIDPGNYDSDAIKDQTTVTNKLYFDDDHPFVYVDEVLTLDVKRDPVTVSHDKINWRILQNKNESGQQLGYIIQSADTQSVEITGVEPGRIIIEATSDDSSKVSTYAFIDVYQLPESISLSQNVVELSIGSRELKEIIATVNPDDTSDKAVIWEYGTGGEVSSGSECLSITSQGTNGSKLRVQAVPATDGIESSCIGKNITLIARSKADTPDDRSVENIYAYLTVKIKE